MNLKELVTREELNPHGYKLSPEQECNFALLHLAINVIRYECGIPFIITSGVRSKSDQQRINPKSMNSAHTMAAACDIADSDGRIWVWVIDNLDFVAENGVYLESRNYTPRWVHMQVVPPKSGNRIFLP